MRTMQRIGCGLSAALMIAAMALGRPGFAAAAVDASPYAPVLQKIFATLDAKGADMTFGGPIAVPLGISRHGEPVAARELPPIRTDVTGNVVYLFYRLEDGSGYIVVKFTKSGFAALRFDQNFDFVAAATEPDGQPAAALSAAAAATMLGQELHDWQAIDERLASQP
jgi:hypothetical protein